MRRPVARGAGLHPRHRPDRVAGRREADRGPGEAAGGRRGRGGANQHCSVGARARGGGVAGERKGPRASQRHPGRLARPLRRILAARADPAPLSRLGGRPHARRPVRARGDLPAVPGAAPRHAGRLLRALASRRLREPRRTARRPLPRHRRAAPLRTAGTPTASRTAPRTARRRPPRRRADAVLRRLPPPLLPTDLLPSERLRPRTGWRIANRRPCGGAQASHRRGGLQGGLRSRGVAQDGSRGGEARGRRRRRSEPAAGGQGCGPAGGHRGGGGEGGLRRRRHPQEGARGHPCRRSQGRRLRLHLRLGWRRHRPARPCRGRASAAKGPALARVPR
mmetsp:Transcript_14117/g.46675  ORF Transcript_14117/g.46675 Transcript_14117/m.46675 type:complete len:336 (-) Transcript_14117:1773-2780(-)